MPWVNEMNKLSDFLAKTQANIAAEEENKCERKMRNVSKKSITGK
jgi:hypothetical protein